MEDNSNIKGIQDLTKQVKIYKINTSFYEIREYSLTDIINYIVNRHRQKTKKTNELGEALSKFEKDDLTYHLYTFTTELIDSPWKEYLPQKLTENENLSIQQPSFVLFVENKRDIYVIIGGYGLHVVKRFFNHTFGLDLLARIAVPEYNRVRSVKFRGVTGNVASNMLFFRNDHRLIDTIQFGKIHTEVNFEFRPETITDVFDFIDDYKLNDSIYGFASSAFQIKYSLTFDQIHELIKKIAEIEKSIQNFVPLSAFTEIKDSKKVSEDLRFELFHKIRKDIIKLFEPKRAEYSKKFDLDFCHPSKMETFYECDEYEVFEKNAHKPFVRTDNKNDIYEKVMQYIWEHELNSELSKFMSFLGGAQVKGYKQEKIVTYAPFMSHITCEINIRNISYFCIDNVWYELNKKFVEDIDQRCQKMVSTNMLDVSMLSKKWENPIEVSEGDYNLSYRGENDYIVLDKILGNNIELCDLLYITEEKLYLIHVKKGFDAKMRDLANQIEISAQNLWHDVSGDTSPFLDSVYYSLEKHENFNYSIVKTKQEFKKLFKEKEIIYVLAFVSTLKETEKITNDISITKSNIAKFSVINCILSMKENNYTMKIAEIDR